jgi:hypothetical protein
LRFNLLCTFEMISRRNNEANKIPHNDRYRWYRPTYGEVDALNIFFLFNIFMFFLFLFFFSTQSYSSHFCIVRCILHFMRGRYEERD